ncbi:MAG: 3-dehydroquinate synthase [Bacteroidia bacterium]|nr:3-dehydroquinate synthase [Bacteroidia bacterium]
MSVLKSNGYNIIIGSDALKSLSAFLLKNHYTSYYILCDDNTLQYCLPILITKCQKLSEAEIIEIESGEQSKSIELSAYIWQTLLEQGADTSTLLINLGGGVVSDLGGFTASVYKRGIDFINIPTSLLAMADASVGGKTAIDFNGVKNSIGSFAQPKSVFVYPDFLRTLNDRHLKNGLAEVYKIALISDSALWKNLKKESITITTDIIYKSIGLKNKIVLKDPFDKGLRKILNFGHSIGHALETLFLGTAKELFHGEAIVAGMLIESHIAFQKKLISKSVLSEIYDTLISVFNPQPFFNLDLEHITDLLKNDKKNLKGKYFFSLPSKIGSCNFDIPVTEVQVKKAFIFYNDLLK